MARPAPPDTTPVTLATGTAPAPAPAPARPCATVQAGPRRRLWSALGVALATVGCAPPGPRTPLAAIEPLRARLPAAPPLQFDVSYLQAGDPTGPRLILVHGTPGQASGWADYLQSPPPGVEVVALDRPGFGHSGPDAAVTGLAEQAAAVVALLPADGRPVLLLGHSLGGAVVARVAADHPQRISAVVLVAASLAPALETIHPLQRLGAWPPLRGLLPRAIRNANAELMAFEPELQALALLLPRITAPVVILHGTADDLVPLANVAFMQSRLSGARCVRTRLLPGHDHFLPWNSQADVRAAIGLARQPPC